jgi:chaperonin GroES
MNVATSGLAGVMVGDIGAVSAVSTTTAQFPPIIPDHGIRPTAFKVLVRADEVKAKTAGGIIIPDEAKDRQQYAATKGELIAVSPLAFGYETWPEGAERPKVGNRVVFAKFAGFAIKGEDGVEYRLIEDKDIAAVLG